MRRGDRRSGSQRTLQEAAAIDGELTFAKFQRVEPLSLHSAVRLGHVEWVERLTLDGFEIAPGETPTGLKDDRCAPVLRQAPVVAPCMVTPVFLKDNDPD